MGYITQKEYEMIIEQKNDIHVSPKVSKEKIEALEKLNNEISEAFKKDYLDEHKTSGLKFGCISLYSPKEIGGLSILCFKIRGLFETLDKAKKRAAN